VQLASMVLWTALVARYIGPGVYGIYAFAQATVSILLIFVNLGLDQLLIRDVAQRPGLGIVYRLHALRLKLGLGLIVLGGFIVFTLVQNRTSEYTAIATIVAVNGLMGAIGTVNAAMINARELMHYSVAAQAVNAVLTLATGALGVWLHWPFPFILLMSLGATCVYVAISGFFARRLYRDVQKQQIHDGRDWRTSFNVAVKSVPFGLLVLISVLSMNLGIVLLRWSHVPDDTVGYFAAALRIYSLVILVPGTLTSALFPGLARIYAESEERFARVFEFAWRFFFLITVPIAVGLWVVARDVILLIYGSEFGAAVPSLQILSLMLLNGVGFVMGTAMTAMNRQTVSAGIQGAALILVAAIAWWAIPRYGAEGVAGAMVVGTLAGFLVYSALLFRWLHLRFPLIWCVKTVLAAGLMAVTCILVRTWTDSLPVILITAAALYLSSHFLLRTLSRCDWAQVVQILPERLVRAIVVK
jgi:O-antigen/teichoic acid export membrane protein